MTKLVRADSCANGSSDESSVMQSLHSCSLGQQLASRVWSAVVAAASGSTSYISSPNSSSESASSLSFTVKDQSGPQRTWKHDNACLHFSASGPNPSSSYCSVHRRSSYSTVCPAQNCAAATTTQSLWTIHSHCDYKQFQTPTCNCGQILAAGNAACQMPCGRNVSSLSSSSCSLLLAVRAV